MRILFLSRWYPYPPSNGSKLRIYSLLRGLAQWHDVTLLSFVDQATVAPDLSALQAICRDVQVVPWKPFQPQSRRARLGFLSLTPRSVIDTFSNRMAELIRDGLSKGSYDLVVASQITMASYAAYFSELPALFEEVETGVLYEQFAHATAIRDRARYGLTWAKHRRYLARLLNCFGGCSVVSERERGLLREAVPHYHPVEVIPNCLSLSDYEGVCERPRRDTLIFTGSFTYGVNHEAMVWFLREVYPRIRAEVPGVGLSITGDHANLPLPRADDVTLTGFVDDVRALIASSWVSLAPIWRGGGTRLKILEAMALRTPVVATSKGAEGLDVQHGEHLLIADTAEAFAAAVVRLLREPGLRQRLVENGYRVVCEKYDWRVVMPRFLELVERIART